MSDIKLESKLGSKFQELDLAKVLCKHVCWIFSTLNIIQRDFLLFNTLSDEVIMNINMFRLFLLYRILSRLLVDYSQTRPYIWLQYWIGQWFFVPGIAREIWHQLS